MRYIIVAICIMFTVSLSAQTYFPPTTGNTWDTINPSSLGWCTDKIQPLYNYLDSNDTKGFIILKNGKIVLEKYFGTFTQDSIWYWASAGKTLTAFCIGMANQEGKLKLTDTTSKYLGKGWTNMTSAQEDKVTIWHQLTMTSGMNDIIFECTTPNCLVYKADAGTRWAYHNSPYTLLDTVLESATGLKLNNFIGTKIKPTAGLNVLFVKSGFNNVCYSTSRNMARFGLLLSKKGVWNGTDILKDSNYYHQMTNTSQNLNKSYGYLTWLNGKSSFMLPADQTVYNTKLLPNAPDDMYAAMGKNGQFINIVPSENIVLIRMGNVPNSTNVPADFNNEIWKRLNDVMCKSNSSIMESDDNIAIYPNPFSDKIFFTEKYSRIDIYDILGKLVLSSKISSNEINAKQLKNGIYFLNIYSKNKLTKRLKITKE